MAATTCSSISVTRESANANFPEEQSSATGTSSFSAQTLLIPVRIALGPLS
jgi:hypothetical protein